MRSFKSKLTSSIERFHSRDQRPYWFAKSKDDFCIKIDFNSRRNDLVHQYAAISLFWNTNVAVVTSHEHTLLPVLSRAVHVLFYYAVVKKTRLHFFSPKKIQGHNGI